jgi:hypothetical protein
VAAAANEAQRLSHILRRLERNPAEMVGEPTAVSFEGEIS